MVPYGFLNVPQGSIPYLAISRPYFWDFVSFEIFASVLDLQGVNFFFKKYCNDGLLSEKKYQKISVNFCWGHISV